MSPRHCTQSQKLQCILEMGQIVRWLVISLWKRGQTRDGQRLTEVIDICGNIKGAEVQKHELQ